MVVKIVSLDELPEWVDKDCVSNNGTGKEYANYILIEDGEYTACYSDAMEPEDCKFSRDLKWIVAEIIRARNSAVACDDVQELKLLLNDLEREYDKGRGRPRDDDEFRNTRRAIEALRRLVAQ